MMVEGNEKKQRHKKTLTEIQNPTVTSDIFLGLENEGS